MNLPRPPSARAFPTSDGGTEPYLINPRRPKSKTKTKKKANPPLIIVNPSHRGKKKMARTIQMKRNNKGQFVAKGRATPRKARRTVARTAAPRRRKAYALKKRNPPTNWTAGVVTNRKRRKKNPAALGLDRQGKIAGIPIPAISDVLYLSLGLGGPPIVKGTALRFMPAAFGTTQLGMYGVEAVSYVVPAAIGWMAGGTRGARRVIAGEAAGILVRLVSQWTAGGGLGNMPLYRGTPGVGAYLGPVASRSLGAYTARTMPTAVPAQTAMVPTARRTRRHSRYS